MRSPQPRGAARSRHAASARTSRIARWRRRRTPAWRHRRGAGTPPRRRQGTARDATAASPGRGRCDSPVPRNGASRRRHGPRLSDRTHSPATDQLERPARRRLARDRARRRSGSVPRDPRPSPLARDSAPARRGDARHDRRRPAPPRRQHDGALLQGGRRPASPGRATVARRGGVAMLKSSIDAYLALRRAVGFRLKTEEYLLDDFARWASDRGETHVRTETAMEWAAAARVPWQRERRLRAVAGFARHARAEDGRHEVPPIFVFARRPVRPVPHIYSPDELRRLLDAASQLPAR